MFTLLALAQARHQDLQREVAELRRLAAARAVGPTPLERPASERRAQTILRLRTRSGLTGDEPCLSTLLPC